MTRSFNTAAPCRQSLHYMLSPTQRLPRLDRFINQEKYFVIHAPRQVGKTTAIQAIAQNLTAQGQHCAVVVPAETSAAFDHDPIAGLTEFANTALELAEKFHIDLPQLAAHLHNHLPK